MEILYGATPGGVNGSKLTSGLRLLTIKPEPPNDDNHYDVNTKNDDFTK